ncbi:RUN domain-containing protein 3B-like isoform X2 [Watersipora subatra]|uniref:RUN domain-containing protein 3B-like isoform X2 n=1 Tax=Watersipora subatra TaxID=2589382 RepID=UPI00355B9735
MGSESLQSRNFYVEKHNLVLVCRFVIKSVIDKASIGDIEEDCPELVNFLATIEHILNHRARVSMFNTGYGNFWNFIREATAKMAENCISKVYAMNSLKSSVARGRCWLRLALMEKRLAAYLKHSIAQPELLKKYYTDGAIILSEEMQLLIADLIGLEAVDLNFCLRSKNMNLEGRILVDYSPYLQFVHCKEGLENDLQEIQESGLTSPNNSVHTTAASQFPHPPTFQHPKGSMSAIADRDVKERLAALQRSFRTTSEQKGYLEQMLKKSELEILARQADREKMLQNKDSQISKLEGDVEQLERIVLELQGDLTRAKSHNKEMQNLITLLYKRVNGTEANDRCSSS